MTLQLPLSEMVTDLRAEVGHSLVGSHGTNMTETLKYQLKRTQRELYSAYEWPALMMDEQQTVAAGSTHLTPFANIIDDQINKIWCAVGTTWVPLIFGIGPDEFSLYPPGTRGWPIQRYAYDPMAKTLQIWPAPTQDTNVYASGQMQLGPLVDDADTSTLDGQMLVLFAAASILARQKDEDAGIMLTKAQQYLTAIIKNQGSQKRPTRSMAGTVGRRPRPGLDYIPQGM